MRNKTNTKKKKTQVREGREQKRNEDREVMKNKTKQASQKKEKQRRETKEKKTKTILDEMKNKTKQNKTKQKRIERAEDDPHYLILYFQVGTAVSLVYSSGLPIVFLGTGQHYTDLKKLNIGAVVKALLR
jgi:hypothetical protein